MRCQNIDWSFYLVRYQDQTAHSRSISTSADRVTSGKIYEYAISLHRSIRVQSKEFGDLLWPPKSLEATERTIRPYVFHLGGRRRRG